MSFPYYFPFNFTRPILAYSVEKALYDALNIAAVNNVATGGVYNSLAPKNIAAPYVVFRADTEDMDYSFAGTYWDTTYIVQAVSRQPWPKEALDIDTQIDSALEDATLTIPSFAQLLCRRESDVYSIEENAGEIWHHIGGRYRIMADQT